MEPLQTLYEDSGLGGRELPAELTRLYGGALGLERPLVYANFVSSIDGIVALPSVAASPSMISGKSEADRFVMGLLRAFADVVLIGAGTLLAEPEHRWTPGFIYPQATDHYAALRRELGLRADPELFVLTATGTLDPSPAALAGATVLTTGRGARRMASGGRRTPLAVVELGEEGPLDVRRVLRYLHRRGYARVLSEGGPKVIGELLAHGVLDELFLTVSPKLFGRTPQERRPGLVEGMDLLQDGPPTGRIKSVRRHGDHLFLRYSLASARREQQRRAA